MQRQQRRSRKIVPLLFALIAGWLMGLGNVVFSSEVFEQIPERVLYQDDYADRLRAMWLGETLANWTGLTTEGVKQDAPFYTDEDWGSDQRLDWKMDSVIDFVFQDPWLADDDTDIEYVYLHLMNQHNTNLLTAEQIAAGWREHVNDYIWVSNARARELMEMGVLPPMTSASIANEFNLQIDAQLTTEIFGAIAPGMPEQALRLANLPIQTTAAGYAAHAAQFHVVLYSLATQVDLTADSREQIISLVREARRYIPDTSKTADIVDFVLTDYLDNPNVNDWERTRDHIYERYHRDAGDYGFVYRGWTESSVNFATGLMALLYGEGDFKRTVQIGTLSGWDSDNGTATMGGLLGLMLGYDALAAQFSDQTLSDRYRIHRTRPTMPDYLPEDRDAQDTFTMMAERMLPLVERTIIEVNGQVEGDMWWLPPIPNGDPLDQNPLIQLYLRSTNNQMRLTGGSVTVSSEDELAPSSLAPVIDGTEHNFSGQEPRRPARAYEVRRQSETITLSVTYDPPVEVQTIIFLKGRSSSMTTLDVEILIDGQWQPMPDNMAMSQQLNYAIPFQSIEFALPVPVMITGVRIIGTVLGPLPEATIMELDTLSS